MAITDVVIVIPAYNPDEKFTNHLKNLRDAGYERIIVVNDGSREDTRHFFDEAEKVYGCDVVVHNVNLGQGRAFKSGYNCFMGKYAKDSIGIIQCDCDGQHHVDDVTRCAEIMRKNPDKFILGVRDFKSKNVPFKSRWGNNITSFVFKAFCGLDIDDTQTGLKGIPTFFIPELMEVPGERFEYCSSTLLETKKAGLEILQFPIQTIYINGNETSHFNPLTDSIRIYSLIFKYMLSSVSAFLVDIIMYTLFLAVFRNMIEGYYVMVSVYASKVVSCTYTFFVNKSIVFENKDKGHSTAVKFAFLCVVQSLLAGFLTNEVVGALHFNEILGKILVDIFLFFFSFQVQNRWVFKKKSKGKING